MKNLDKAFMGIAFMGILIWSMWKLFKEQVKIKINLPKR